MKNLSSWLIAMFAFMFWGFRVFITVLYSLGTEYIAVPIDMTTEIVLLFITFICICFIAKRKLIPTIVYLIAHAMYYGYYIYQNVIGLIEETGTINDYLSILIAFIGVAIPVAAFFDVLLDRNRKAHPVDKQTDWFYKNKEFDRKMDDRADKNQYKTL